MVFTLGKVIQLETTSKKSSKLKKIALILVGIIILILIFLFWMAATVQIKYGPPPTLKYAPPPY